MERDPFGFRTSDDVGFLPEHPTLDVGQGVRLLVGKYTGGKARVCSVSKLSGLHWVYLTRYEGTLYRRVTFGPYILEELEKITLLSNNRRVAKRKAVLSTFKRRTEAREEKAKIGKFGGRFSRERLNVK